MKLTISISDITKRIYAISAMKAVSASDSARPAVLTRDNALLLRRLIRDCFARTVGEMASRVSDFSPLDPDNGDDILWLESSESACLSPGVASETLATAVLCRVMELAYAGEECAGQYASLAADTISGLRRMSAHCGRLHPFFA